MSGRCVGEKSRCKGTDPHSQELVRSSRVPRHKRTQEEVEGMVLIRKAVSGGHSCTRLDNSSFLHVTDLSIRDSVNKRNQHSNNNSMKKKTEVATLPFISLSSFW